MACPSRTLSTKPGINAAARPAARDCTLPAGSFSCCFKLIFCEDIGDHLHLAFPAHSPTYLTANKGTV